MTDWIPNEGDYFYYINERGHVMTKQYNDKIDYHTIAFGNCFKYEHRAKKAARAIFELLKGLEK